MTLCAFELLGDLVKDGAQVAAAHPCRLGASRLFLRRLEFCDQQIFSVCAPSTTSFLTLLHPSTHLNRFRIPLLWASSQASPAHSPL